MFYRYDYIVVFTQNNTNTPKIVFKTNDLKEAQAFCSNSVDSADGLYKDGCLTIFKARETYNC